MSRQIKFRLWDHDGPEPCMHYLGPATIYDNCICFDVDPNKGHNDSEDAIIMQFTGLQDKNGVDIFEDDLIVSESNANTVVVIWGTYEAKLKNWPAGLDDMEMTGWVAENISTKQREPLDSSFTNGIIIGNIHQHLELLNPSRP